MSIYTILVFTVVCATVTADKLVTVEVNNVTAECGQTTTVATEDIVTVIAKGDIPSSACTLTFDTGDSNCHICYMFEKYALFNTSLASVNLTRNSESIFINITEDFPTKYNCTETSALTIELIHEPGYQHTPDKPRYSFTLDVYNQCGYRGRARSVVFEQIVQYVKGYHHGSAKADQERRSLVSGLGVSIALASVFLVVFLASYCYVKNSPNRRASLTMVKI